MLHVLTKIGSTTIYGAFLLELRTSCAPFQVLRYFPATIAAGTHLTLYSGQQRVI